MADISEMMTDAERDEALKHRPTPNHVTRESIEGKIQHTQYVVEGVMTIAIVTLENGYTVTGQSACADPANYDKALGEKIAYDDAVKKVWPLEGYLLRQRLFEQGIVGGSHRSASPSDVG